MKCESNEIFVVQFSGQQSKRVENDNNKIGHSLSLSLSQRQNTDMFVARIFHKMQDCAFDFAAAACNVLVFVFAIFRRFSAVRKLRRS